MNQSNEAITCQIFRDQLRGNQPDWYQDPNIIIEEQLTNHKLIKKHLKQAGKSGKGGSGRPDFIIRHKKYKDLILIVEAKADSSKQISDKLNKPVEYAVDGALYYAKHLTNKFKVVAIGISGQNQKEFKFDAYFCTTAGHTKLDISGLLPFDELYHLIYFSPAAKEESERQLSAFTKDLHNYLRDYAKVSEAEKPLLVGVCLVALRNKSFRDGYSSAETGEDLCENLYGSLKYELSKAKIPDHKEELMLLHIKALLSHPELRKGEVGVNSTLFEVVDRLDQRIRPFLEEWNSFDVLGHFYQEFLSYTAGDKKSQGIVLTPRHITELFVKLARISPNDIVLDTCCGTGGFLISSMFEMISSARGDKEVIDNIKTKQLIGIEQAPNMFSLAALNLLLRGDGKSQLHQGSCFDIKESIQRLKNKPTVGLINPPYAQKGEGLSELDFIECMLDCLSVGGTGIVIVPMSVCISGSRAIKERLIKYHTLKAVMTMPPELFYPVGVNTVAMVWQANIPHNSSIPTWFAAWKDDGFIKTKNQGRCDFYGAWADIKKQWIDDFFRLIEKPGYSVLKTITPNNEWIAEAYLEADYSQLTSGQLKNIIKTFAIFESESL